MSQSESALLLARASSSQWVPADALREALFQVVADLARQGATPADILRMRIFAPEPQAFHLSRRQNDLAWREVFGGLRKAVFYAQGPVAVEADAEITAVREAKPVWNGMTMPELTRAYAPRLQVANMQDVFRGWNADGALARQHAGALDLHYGRGCDEMFDFYPAARAHAPLWVFLHGGYWQACTKDQHGQFAVGMRAHGFSVAMLDYPLCPETPLAEIVLVIRYALQSLRAQAGALGFDPTQIHLAGHSAGAHLAAMAAADPHGPDIASVLLLSGVFDLDPLFHLPMGAIIGLKDRAQASALSPLFCPQPKKTRVGLALGALETDEFKRQSGEMAAAWGAEAPLQVENCHHFNLLEELRRPGPLLDLALRTASS